MSHWIDTSDELFDAKESFPTSAFHDGALIRYCCHDGDFDDQGESIGRVLDVDAGKKGSLHLDVEPLGSSDDYYA